MAVSLPLATESVSCSDFARVNAVEAAGTALAPDVVVLVEVDEPWPKPVGNHEAMVALVKAVQGRPENIRLLAAVPTADAPHRVIAFRSRPGGATRSEALLCADPVGALHAVLDDADPTPLSVDDGVAAMLVCTQGTHDACCGSRGAPFADWADAQRGIETFRVSHVGGHRYAPTAMTLPDGRMWAYLDEDRGAAIIDRRFSDDLAGVCRGWWGATTGPAQVGELAVFARVGFDLDRRERAVSLVDHDGYTTVFVDVEGERYTIDVEPGREVPVIACEAPGGLPVKPGREWRVRSFGAPDGSAPI